MVLSSVSEPRHWATRSINNDDLITSMDWVTNCLTECQFLVDSVLHQSRMGDKLPALQDRQPVEIEQPTRTHRARRSNYDLVITATLEGRTVRLQPLPATGLRLDNYEAPMENPLRLYPFGLENA
jgi:hypothetical protein